MSLNIFRKNLLYRQLRTSAEEGTQRNLDMVLSTSALPPEEDNLLTLGPFATSAEIQPITDSTVGKIIIGTVLSLVIFLSIFGNVLVCLAVYTDRNLRKIGNLFVVSLAIADLFVACLVMTFALVNDLLGYWPFGDQYCDTWIAFDVMCSTASIINLCAISLDRYIHIKDPLRYGRWMTKRIVMFSIAAIWVISALVSFLPISLDLHQPAQGKLDLLQDEESNQCALDLTPTFAVVSSCISFFLPCIVMLILYSRLYHYAQKHVASIKAQFRPVTLGSLEGEGGKPKKVAATYHVSESKAATTVGIIVGTFLVCWVPFFCVNIVASFCKTCIPPLVFKILTWFGYTNSSLNPIIYSIFNQEFREGFRRILLIRCQMQKLPCCSQNAKDYGNYRFNYYPSTKSTTVIVTPRKRSCCSSCKFGSVSICCAHFFRCPGSRSSSIGSPSGSFNLAKHRSSDGSETCIPLPHRHQNGSPSIATAELEVLSTTPRNTSFDRNRASIGEKCLILEQISTI